MKWLLVIVGLFNVVATQACEVIDDAGHHIKLTHPAQRIISLAPDLTENLFAVGAGKQIVGTMQGSDYPEAAKLLPVVATYQSIDLEKIYAAKPDLILVWGEGRLAESLRDLNIPIYISHPQKILDVVTTLKNLGCLTGKEKQAENIIKNYQHQYATLQKKYSPQTKLKVFYQVWQQPLITISDKSWINDAITLCGGNNIFKYLKGAAPEVNLEAVLVANPRVILGTFTQINWQSFWKKWPALSAVKKNHLYNVHSEWIERATPRLLQGVEEMCLSLEKARED